MRITVLFFCSVLSFFFISPVFAVSTDESLPGFANDRFYPQDVATKQKEQGNFMYQACATLGGLGLFNCELLRSQDVIAPDEMGIDEEKINDADQTLGAATKTREMELEKLEKDLDTATTSAQVLGVAEGLTKLVNRILGGDQSAFRAYSPASMSICDPNGILNDCPAKVANALRPASMQVAQNNPVDPTIPIDVDGDGMPDDSNTDPIVPTDPTQPIEPTPVPGSYQVYFQNDPTYANFQLPGKDDCRYIQAACGPFTVVNAFVNSGITSIDDGRAVTPKYIVDTYYPFATCAGTSIDAAYNILTTHGFSANYLFNINYEAPDYKSPSEIATEFKNYTESGSMIFGLADFWSSYSNKWIGHFFLVVKVANGKIYTLDPYYGYGQPIPFDQSTMTVRYKSAFRFKRV